MSVKTQLDVRAEQEDIQTSYDANLFSDEEMEDSASQPQNQCNKLDTPQYNMFLDTLDKGRLPAKKKVVATISDKRRIKEVDYSEALRQIVYNQTERMNNMRREMETDAQKKQSEYLCNMDETKKRWEAALREQEEKLAMARKELEDNRAQQQQQLQDHIRESGEALSQANRASIEASMQQILDDSRERLTQELAQREAKLGQELARREEELSGKKNEEAEKECELANMEQRFAERHRLQDLDIYMDTSHSRRKDAGQPDFAS
ncbi:hypothetical protein BD769DRAFT_1397207 [Suillus cothurnatus]|nr:hypothetical protein BD769DRAFT_1397207 [Suillus cothurnatus]